MSDNKKARPSSVMGPYGKPLTLQDLPAPDTKHWVAMRKAEVIAACRGGLLTKEETCARYSLSPEEFASWQASVDRAGIPGLRTTKVQFYRTRKK